jgi:hypothetical protein
MPGLKFFVCTSGARNSSYLGSPSYIAIHDSFSKWNDLRLIGFHEIRVVHCAPLHRALTESREIGRCRSKVVFINMAVMTILSVGLDSGLNNGASH